MKSRTHALPLRMKIAVAGGLTLALAAFVPSAYAYLLCGSGPVENNLSIGSVATEIVEEFDEPDDLNPGDIVAKSVAIENTGDSAAWVRVLLAFSPSSCSQWAVPNIDETMWADGGDGFYYYKQTLQPGQTTKPLLTQVAISENVAKSDLRSFDLIVCQESVQAAPYESAVEAFQAMAGDVS